MKRMMSCLFVSLLCLVSVLPGFAGTEGKKAVMVVTFDGFEDNEYKYTRAKLDDAGIVVSVAAAQMGRAKGQAGRMVDVDLTLADVNVADYDAVVFIGGKGSQTLVDRPEAHRIARDAMEQGKVLGAICYSPVALAKAGVLDGREATVADAWSGPRILKENGCNYKNSSVVVDGKLVTANGPKAAKKFGSAVVEVLDAQ
ncbi:MAG: DJ-1/PfpI family protein [Desulfovibrionaceae bacterium]